MSLLKELNIYDKLISFYILFSLIWIVYGRDNIEAPSVLFLKFLGVLSTILFLIILNYFINNPLIRFCRYWHPILFLGFYFDATTRVDLVIFKEYLDPFFQHLDYMIFGYQPAILWGTKLDNFFVYEFFYAAYFSYYAMIFGVLFVLYKRKKEEFVRALYNVMFVFIACYLVYIVLPVIGGRALEGAREITETYRYGLFTHIMTFIYRGTSHNGAAFPSSHVAIAFTLTFISFKHFFKMRWVLLITSIFLSISTVFCHYHYFVDAIAGIIYAFIMYIFSEILFAYFEYRNEKKRNNIDL